MQGFKSFADKIELEFGKGITAIVGPNGSGKSNVSDAIRWVMGEQSAKSLRGSKMEDVIFSGTQNRKPLGFAEVSIILDNADRKLNLDFDTVTVTRRVHRSGEGEYFINKSPCRLKDIYELFMDTGIGREGYSVVGQGKIDEILSSKSEDRRHIFEEAAGISKYKYRKNEAEKKLAKTEENLLRIKDIVSELSSQVGPLKTQSEKAKKYLDLREVLKVLEINIAIINIEKYRENAKKCENDLKITISQLEDARKKQNELDSEVEKFTALLQTENEKSAQINQQKYELEKNEGGFLNKIELIKSEISHNNENIERLKNDNGELCEKIKILDEENAQKKAKLDEVNAQIESLCKALETLCENDEELDIKLENSLKDIENQKADIIELLNENTNLSANSDGLDALCKNFADRKESIKNEIALNENSLKICEEQLEKCGGELEKCKKLQNECNAGLDVLKKEYFSITAENDALKAEQNSITAEYNTKNSKRRALEDLEKSLEGYSKGVKEVINSKSDGICGVISKLLTVDEKYVVAIETALGRAMQNIVTDSEETAKRCIETLKRSKSGRATFLPLTSVRGEVLKNAPKNERGYIGIASNLISYDEKYEGIFSYLLGRTVIADNIDSGVAISKKFGYKFKVVTLDGQVLNAGGSITGGSSDARLGLISRSKNIEQLKADTDLLSKKIDKNDSLIAKNNQKIKEIAAKKEEFDLSISECERNIVRLCAEKNHLDESIKNLGEKIRLLGGESGDINTQIEDIDKNKAALAEKIAANDEKISSIRNAVTGFEEGLALVRAESENIKNEISAKKIKQNGLCKDLEFITENISEYSVRRSEYEGEILKNTNLSNSFVRKNSDLQNEILNIEKSMGGMREIFAEFENQLESLKNKQEKILADIKEKSRLSKENQEVVLVLVQESTRCENKVAKAENDIEGVINKLWDDYEITYSDAQSYKKEIENFSEAQREVSSIKRKIKELGNINIDAIEEYKAVSERYEFLSAQENDLNESKKNLTGIIDNMQSVMKEKFISAFYAISEEFKNVFASLFGGGIAKIYLADESDVLTSGIEIEVQPPGKKLQNLTLLSGGERAFSAIALLFAVLKTAPTPFCLLDEVEAALDEANVYKFANYAKKFTSDTQFLIVTHRRGTMETADILYGVTMQEKGVSKLLKLNFDDLEENDV